ncbi:lysozyme g-like [Carettochelys insculpta]|uniref:lysozyme g-like n=1 Tax=Carettochelys insculpta TaxID=44489 RepID=UPI003EB8F6FA
MLLSLLFLGLAALVAPSVSYGCYGDLQTIQTPEVSCEPVQTPACGVQSAAKLVQVHIIRLRQYEVPIKRVAKIYCIDPALIGALISVESGAGLNLVDGWNRDRTRYGLMQIHKHYNTIPVAWDSEDHIAHGTNILVTSMKELRIKHPTWTWQQCLIGGLCAFHDKVRNIQVYDGTDNCNLNNNYVNTVLVRAKTLQTMGFTI